MLTTHARSVFTHSCLSTPRDTRPQLETSGSNRTTSAFGNSRVKVTPRSRSRVDEDDNFGITLKPGSPYIQHSLISPRPSNGYSRQAEAPLFHHSPDSFPGNERQSGDDEMRDYATLFATLLESNTLLREEIQSLKEEQTSTQKALEHLSRRDEVRNPQPQRDQLSKSLPQVLENTWVEPNTHEHSDIESSVSNSPLHSCQSCEHSLHSPSPFDGSIASSPSDSEQDETINTETAEEVPPEHFHSDLEFQNMAQEDSIDSTSEASSSCSSGTSASNSAYSQKPTSLAQNDPFASSGVLAVEKMWDDFSVDDYTFEAEPDRDTTGKNKSKEWTPKITIPQPFAMTIRESTTPKQKSRSILTAEREEMERRAKGEAELRKQFHATPVPANTFLPLYDLVNAKNEQRRERVKSLSKEILKSTEKPFSFSKREETKKQANAEFVRQSQKFERTQEHEDRQFKAKPIPRQVFDPKTDEKIQEQEEYRQIRLQMRAEELLASSKLPGNMQIKGREYTVGSLRKKRLETNEKRAFLTNDHKFHPSVGEGIPNYTQAYEKFHEELAKRKSLKHTTTTEPFYLRTELIPSRKEQVLNDLKADEEVLPENRWPFIATRKKVSRKSPARPKRTSRSVSEGAATYPAQMTATARVRQSLTKEKLADILAKETAEEEKRREKKERDRTLKAAVSQKSLSYDPTAWLEEKQKEKLHQFRQEDRERQEKYQHQLEKMKQRVEARPLLLEQASLHTLQKSAEAKYISALKKAGLSDEDIQALNKKPTATQTD